MFSSRRRPCAYEEKHWSGKRLAGHLGLSQGCLRSLLGQFKKTSLLGGHTQTSRFLRRSWTQHFTSSSEKGPPLRLKGWSQAPWTYQQCKLVLPTWHCHQTPAQVSFSLQTLLQCLAQLDKIKRLSPLQPSQAGRRPCDHMLCTCLTPSHFTHASSLRRQASQGQKPRPEGLASSPLLPEQWPSSTH